MEELRMVNSYFLGEPDVVAMVNKTKLVRALNEITYLEVEGPTVLSAWAIREALVKIIEGLKGEEFDESGK